IPTVRAGHDVLGCDHRTGTKVYARILDDNLREHHHFRLALLEFALPLDKFQNVKQLCVEVLHRDISPGNIMITNVGKGLLVDWDLSTDIDRVDVESPPERTGKWQFMAARLLLAPENRPIPDYTDDLESFWYTLLYITLLKCEHAYKLGEVVSTLNYLFHYMVGDEGKKTGGTYKRYELQTHNAQGDAHS
ncbi:hypothetical protein M413DRAFT_70734, partial [Hebeloma cylindrosporum]